MKPAVVNVTTSLIHARQKIVEHDDNRGFGFV